MRNQSAKNSPPKEMNNSPAENGPAVPPVTAAPQVQLSAGAGGGGKAGAAGGVAAAPAAGSHWVVGESGEGERVWQPAAVLASESRGEGGAADDEEGEGEDGGKQRCEGAKREEEEESEGAREGKERQKEEEEGEALNSDGVGAASQLVASEAIPEGEADWLRRVEDAGWAMPAAKGAGAVGSGSGPSASAAPRSRSEHLAGASAVHVDSPTSPTRPEREIPARPPKNIADETYRKPLAGSKKNHRAHPRPPPQEAPCGRSRWGNEDAAGGGRRAGHIVGRGGHAENTAGGGVRARTTVGEGTRAAPWQRDGASLPGADMEAAGADAAGGGRARPPNGEGRARRAAFNARAVSAGGRPPPFPIRGGAEAVRSRAVSGAAAADAVQPRPPRERKPSRPPGVHLSAREHASASVVGGGECTGGGTKGAGAGLGGAWGGIAVGGEVGGGTAKAGGVEGGGAWGCRAPNRALAGSVELNSAWSASAAGAPLRLGAMVEALPASSAVFEICRRLLQLQPPPVFSRKNAHASHGSQAARDTFGEVAYSQPPHRRVRGTCHHHGDKNSLDQLHPGGPHLPGGGYSYSLLRVMQLRRHMPPAQLQQALEAAVEAAGAQGEVAGRGKAGGEAGTEAGGAMGCAGGAGQDRVAGASSVFAESTGCEGQHSAIPHGSAPRLVFACGQLDSLGRFIRAPLWPQPDPSPTEPAPLHGGSILFSDRLIHTGPCSHTETSVHTQPPAHTQPPVHAGPSIHAQTAGLPHTLGRNKSAVHTTHAVHSPPAMHTPPAVDAPAEAQGTLALCVWRTVLAMAWDAAATEGSSGSSSTGGGGASRRSDRVGASDEGGGTRGGNRLGGGGRGGSRASDGGGGSGGDTPSSDSVRGASSRPQTHGPETRPLPAGIASPVAAARSGGVVPLFVLDYVVSADGSHLV